VQHNEPNTAATGGLYDFWPDYPGKVLIFINYFALHQMMA
jgi:hypothetical protein